MRQVIKPRAMMPAAVLAATLLAAVPHAAAQQPNWRASSQNGSQRAYIDTASIRRDGDKVHFVREIRMGETRQFETGERYDRIGSRMEADCRARTIRSLEVYAKLGDALVARGPDSGTVQTARPGSTVDIDLRAACFNEWPPR